MQKEAIFAKMLDFYQGNLADINHFIKVYALASFLGKQEALEPGALETLEIAAIVHDIACPLCREKYGDTDGKHQEQESAALLTEFLREFHLPSETEQRIQYLVTHHHTYCNNGGFDHQILLEADFLVNAGESEKYAKNIQFFHDRIFQTKSGLHLLECMYLLHRRPLECKGTWTKQQETPHNRAETLDKQGDRC